LSETVRSDSGTIRGRQEVFDIRGRGFVWALGYARFFFAILLSDASCLLRVDVPLVYWPHLESELSFGEQEDRRPDLTRSTRTGSNRGMAGESSQGKPEAGQCLQFWFWISWCLLDCFARGLLQSWLDSWPSHLIHTHTRQKLCYHPALGGVIRNRKTISADPIKLSAEMSVMFSGFW